MATGDSLPVKTAQQMAIDGDQPPSKYIFNSNNTTKFGPLETSPPFAPVPIIDIGCFFSSSKQNDQQAELAKLRSALTTWGCFQSCLQGSPKILYSTKGQILAIVLKWSRSNHNVSSTCVSNTCASSHDHHHRSPPAAVVLADSEGAGGNGGGGGIDVLKHMCFTKTQAVNHGLSDSYLENIRQTIKQFFKLPLEEKRKYFREIGSVEGYGNDMTYSDNQVQDWCDRLFLRILPKDQRKLQFWPENPSNFRETIDDYTNNIMSISLVIFEAMARSLGLEINCFSKCFSEERDVLQGRFILYPPCPIPDQVLGLKAHSDRSGITVLLQDPETEGLQVLNDGKWYMVPVIRDALFVNLGDQMQIMSNGIFKSPVHRVVTNKEKGRISVAMFTEPHPNKDISPVDDLVNEKMPRVYKTVKNYAVFNHECFQKGIVALDAVKM